MELLDHVRATVRRYQLLQPGTRTLVAVSGGSDSVALAHLSRLLHDAGDLTMVGIAHLNHRLREDAVDDVAFCESVARMLRVPYETADADVAGHAAAHGLSIEAAAHNERYAFLNAAARRLGAERIALGHTMDDQAETVLLRLLRGAGSRGLAGMHPRRGAFIRPLVDVRRDDLRGFLRDRGIQYRDDSTNADRRIPRNRIRAELLPILIRDYNPRLVELLSQQADIARDEWAWLQQAAHSLTKVAVSGDVPEWQIAVTPMRASPLAVVRVALRDLMERAALARPISSQHVAGMLSLVLADADGATDFPGHRAERRGDFVVLRSRLPSAGRGIPAPGPLAPFRYSLPVPGEARIPEAGLTVSAEVREGVAGCDSNCGDSAIVRWTGGSDTRWAVRGRKPGDRLTLQGLAGRKKLQDLFVDRKVPRARRDQIPLVVDEHDRIVWVPGHAISREFRVTDSAQAVIILTLRLWGGPA